jgi:type VI secretion system protein ImpH
MASQRRPQIPAVIEELFADAKRFDFFQAVRLLERDVQRQGPAAEESRQAVGRDAVPKQELIRFRARQSLDFPVSEIDEVVRPDAAGTAGQPEMLVNFMGLTGPAGVLPRHYSQMIMAYGREGSAALVDFFDRFNHRLISLFYRAWEKYRAGILVEQNRFGQSAADIDLFSFALFSLVGLGTGGQRGRMAIHDDHFLYYSGCFSQRPPNPASLQGMLQEILKSQVWVQQFFGQWLKLLPEEQTCMPRADEVPTLRVQLGGGAVAGERVWDMQSKFRVRIGPVGYAFFCRMMPSADRLLPTCQFIRTYVGPEFDFDVQLVLRGPEVPWCALDGKARLGWNTWVRASAFQRDVDDVVFCLNQV